MSKRNLPHTALVTFDIDVRTINVDETVSEPISDERLLRYNMTKKAQIVITGTSEADCIQNIKNKLEKLNEPLGE
jgi:hypothetical protein